MFLIKLKKTKKTKRRNTASKRKSLIWNKTIVIKCQGNYIEIFFALKMDDAKCDRIIKKGGKKEKFGTIFKL